MKKLQTFCASVVLALLVLSQTACNVSKPVQVILAAVNATDAVLSKLPGLTPTEQQVAADVAQASICASNAISAGGATVTEFAAAFKCFSGISFPLGGADQIVLAAVEAAVNAALAFFQPFFQPATALTASYKLSESDKAALAKAVNKAEGHLLVLRKLGVFSKAR